MEEARDNLEVRHSVALISSSATEAEFLRLGDGEPPFGSTDTIECNPLGLKPSSQSIARHSVALISSSATGADTGGDGEGEAAIR